MNMGADRKEEMMPEGKMDATSTAVGSVTSGLPTASAHCNGVLGARGSCMHRVGSGGDEQRRVDVRGLGCRQSGTKVEGICFVVLLCSSELNFLVTSR